MTRTETVSDIYLFNAQKSFLKCEFFKLAIQEDHCIVFNHLCGPLRLLILKCSVLFLIFFFLPREKIILNFGTPPSAEAIKEIIQGPLKIGSLSSSYKTLPMPFSKACLDSGFFF